MKNKGFIATLREMIRMWFLIFYLDKHRDPTYGEHWLLRAKPSQWAFENYLVFDKHFCEDWKDTLRRYYHVIMRRPDNLLFVGARHSTEQRSRIEDVIQHCVDRGLIQQQKPPFYASSTNTIIYTDHKSRDFLKLLTFLTAISERYGSLRSGFIGAIMVAIVWLTTYLHK